MAPILGCIADDVTGATDLAAALVRGGMRVVQLLGVPGPADPVPEVDAVVVALKSRTAPVTEAVGESLAAADRLVAAGVQQIYFKYCSTFDSLPTGNIGPVADALRDRLEVEGPVLVCPATPENGRTVYQGHLFVGDRLLNESGMQDHPLTPMRDADLVRVMEAQSRGPVGLVDHHVVRGGAGAVIERLRELAETGRHYAVADALDEDDLAVLGAAAAGHRLVTGASGLAGGLPGNHRLPHPDQAAQLPTTSGGTAIVAGSCSRATLRQLEVAEAVMPVLRLDPLSLPDAGELAERAVQWAADRLPGPLVIAASADPQRVREVQQRLGTQAAGDLVEQALATVSHRLVQRGVSRLVVAGGETSGAVVARLGIRQLRVGPEIDPGVPWMWTDGPDGRPLLLALKSGNFGAEDFFVTASA